MSQTVRVLGARYKDRQGGYVRIMKSGFRYGDMAPMAIINSSSATPPPKAPPTAPASKPDRLRRKA